MATFTNRATLTFNGGTVDSNTVTGTFLETLSLTKAAIPDTYAAGDTVTYAVALVNVGTTPLSGITVTDTLGAFDLDGVTLYPLTFVPGSVLLYVNGVLQPTPVPTSTQPLTFEGFTVPAGGDAVLVFAANVSDQAPLEVGGQITNEATATGGGLPEAISDSVTVTVEERPSLSMTKSLSPTSVAENGTVVYTLTIQNLGNTAAVETDDLQVTDVFDPVLDVTSVVLDGTVLAEGTGYTYDPATGEFTTVAGVITVPAATFVRQADGSVAITPGQSVLSVSGTI